MNVAIKPPARTIRHRTILFATITALAFSAAIYAIERGPFRCDNGCSAQIPIDSGTREFLNAIVFRDSVPGMILTPDDTYIICSATHCTNYKRDSNRNYTGSNRRVNPESGGGGGGVNGDFGGMGGGGGWWDGGTGGGDPYSGKGTVIVSDPTVIQ